jgi:ABC-type arginine/histidine transport system permease subunit
MSSFIVVGLPSLTQLFLLYPGLGLAMLEQHKRSSVTILLCLKN